jgi:hypothetical protein
VETGWLSLDEVRKTMLDLSYSLTIESTDDPSFFSFYSPEKASRVSEHQWRTACTRRSGA